MELPRGTGVAFTVPANDTMVIAAAGKFDTGEQVILFYSSKDLGLSWEVAGTIRAHPFSRIGEGFLSLTQLQDGTVLFPVCRWTPGPRSHLKWTAFHHSVFRSSDGGQNWRSGAPTFEGVFEAHLVEMDRSSGVRTKPSRSLSSRKTVERNPRSSVVTSMIWMALPAVWALPLAMSGLIT